MTAQNSETIRAALQALSDLPSFLKPYTVTGTKQPAEDIGDLLLKLVAELPPILDGVHYEGVPYDYQDEPPTIESLRARCEALGYELIVTDKGEQFVIESRDRDNTVGALFIRRNEQDDSPADWIADRELVSERVRTRDPG